MARAEGALPEVLRLEPEAALRVSLADKAAQRPRDYETYDEALLERFTVGKAEQRWCYEAPPSSPRASPDDALAGELRAVVDRLRAAWS